MTAPDVAVGRKFKRKYNAETQSSDKNAKEKRFNTEDTEIGAQRAQRNRRNLGDKE